MASVWGTLLLSIVVQVIEVARALLSHLSFGIVRRILLSSFGSIVHDLSITKTSTSATWQVLVFTVEQKLRENFPCQSSACIYLHGMHFAY